MRRISEADSLTHLIPSVLKNDSYKWYQSQVVPFTSFAEFSVTFRTHYRQFYDKDSQRASLYFLFQEQNENIEAFCWRVSRNYREVDPFANESDICQRIINSARKEYEFLRWKNCAAGRCKR